MHDIRAIRDAPDVYVDGWSRRGVSDARAQVEHLLVLDTGLRQAQTAFQSAQGRRNELSKLIGAAKAQKDEAKAAQALMGEVEALKELRSTSHYKRRGRIRGRQLKEQLAANCRTSPPRDVPDGADEAGNVEVRRLERPRRRCPPASLNATPKDHVALGEAHRA